MALKWYCWHRGLSSSSDQRKIWISQFPYVVDVDYGVHDYQEVNVWLDLIGMSQFGCNLWSTSSSWDLNWFAFYFDDPKVARMTRLVWP